MQLRAAFEVQVVDPAGEGALAVGALEMIDDRHFAVLAADDEGVGKHGGIFAFDPMEDLNRQGDLGVLWHVEQCAGAEAGLVQGGVFV